VALVTGGQRKTEEAQYRNFLCPLWVKSGLFSRHHFMSALPPKADINPHRLECLLFNFGCVFMSPHPSHLNSLVLLSARTVVCIRCELLLTACGEPNAYDRNHRSCLCLNNIPLENSLCRREKQLPCRLQKRILASCAETSPEISRSKAGARLLSCWENSSHG